MKNKSLIIKKTKQKPLSKEQQAFNRSVNKIKRLRLENEQLQSDLENALKFFHKEISPLHQRTLEKKKELVKLLFPFIGIKGLARYKSSMLQEYVVILLEEIVLSIADCENDELKVYEGMLQMLSGINKAELEEDCFEQMKDGLEQMMFFDYGIDIDLSQIKPGMKPEEMESFFSNYHEKEQQKQANSSKKETKNSAKQKADEERQKQKEEAKSKSVATIYRQLAKVLHPDLEMNESLKLKKDSLMKQLTEAYKKKDLHTMLTLELEWIKKEENFSEMSKEKLKIYNELLNEQIADLEADRFDIMHDPRFVIIMTLDFFNPFRAVESLRIQREELLTMEEEMINSLKKLKGRNPMAEVRAIISEFEEGEFDFYEELPF